MRVKDNGGTRQAEHPRRHRPKCLREAGSSCCWCSCWLGKNPAYDKELEEELSEGRICPLGRDGRLCRFSQVLSVWRGSGSDVAQYLPVVGCVTVLCAKNCRPKRPKFSMIKVTNVEIRCSFYGEVWCPPTLNSKQNTGKRGSLQCK